MQEDNKVPVGLSTTVGLSAAAVAGVIAAVTAFLSGDHSTETIGALISGAIVLYGVIRGRSDQAAAKTIAVPVVSGTGQAIRIVEDEDEDDDVPDAAIENELSMSTVSSEVPPDSGDPGIPSVTGQGVVGDGTDL